jgi:hypothetical protein
LTKRARIFYYATATSNASSRAIERREFQRQLIAELRGGEILSLDEPFFERIETKLNKSFPPGRRMELAQQWVEELLHERIVVPAPGNAGQFQFNRDPIIGETALERFDKLPPDAVEERMPVTLVILYAVNSFLFLVLSFFFLPESVVKILGSAAGVALGVFGLKSLNPREDGVAPKVWQTGLVGGTLWVATFLQVILLGIGFRYPCRIEAVPGSTVLVDGKFLERTPDPSEEDQTKAENQYSPENIQLWLKLRLTRHFLRWETHEIKITKKWYLESKDRSQESVQNVSVDWKLWNPDRAFEKWGMKSELRPFLKIRYGLGGQGSSSPFPDSGLTPAELPGYVDEWDRLWASVFDQTDVIGHKREPYVAAVELVQDASSVYLDFQIRDWMNNPVKALRPIPPTRPSIDVTSQTLDPLAFHGEKLKQLLAESLREDVFKQLLAELGIPKKIKPRPAATNIVALSQEVKKQVEEPTPTPVERPTATATPLPSPTPTPGPSTTAFPTPAATARPSITPLGSPTPLASPEPSPSLTPPMPVASSTPLKDLLKELEQAAMNAAKNGQLDVAVSAREQFAQIARKPTTGSTDKIQIQANQSSKAIEKAITEKSGRGRIYIHIADESQRAPAKDIATKLKDAGFGVIGIQNVGGRAYIPDTAEVRFFVYPDSKETAVTIVNVLKDNNVAKPRPSYVIPSRQEKENSIDIKTHFEIWLARDSFTAKTGD